MSPMYLPEEQKMLRAWQTNALHIMAKEPQSDVNRAKDGQKEEIQKCGQQESLQILRQEKQMSYRQFILNEQRKMIELGCGVLSGLMPLLGIYAIINSTQGYEWSFFVCLVYVVLASYYTACADESRGTWMREGSGRLALMVLTGVIVFWVQLALSFDPKNLRQHCLIVARGLVIMWTLVSMINFAWFPQAKTFRSFLFGRLKRTALARYVMVEMARRCALCVKTAWLLFVLEVPWPVKAAHGFRLLLEGNMVEEEASLMRHSCVSNTPVTLLFVFVIEPVLFIVQVSGACFSEPEWYEVGLCALSAYFAFRGARDFVKKKQIAAKEKKQIILESKENDMWVRLGPEANWVASLCLLSAFGLQCWLYPVAMASAFYVMHQVRESYQRIRLPLKHKAYVGAYPYVIVYGLV